MRRGWLWGLRGLVIDVIPLAEDCLAAVQVPADAVQVDDPAAADLGGGDGLGLDPAAHGVLGDFFEAEHFSQDELRAERCVAEIGDAYGIPFEGKPHYSRLFHIKLL